MIRRRVGPIQSCPGPQVPVRGVPASLPHSTVVEPTHEGGRRATDDSAPAHVPPGQHRLVQAREGVYQVVDGLLVWNGVEEAPEPEASRVEVQSPHPVGGDDGPPTLLPARVRMVPRSLVLDRRIWWAFDPPSTDAAGQQR